MLILCLLYTFPFTFRKNMHSYLYGYVNTTFQNSGLPIQACKVCQKFRFKRILFGNCFPEHIGQMNEKLS